jgi:large subunit ribosomal protein L4
VGAANNPLWRSGGTVFGPAPRDYTQAFPKKKRRGAVKVVLSDKLRNDRIVVVDDLALESHRTQDFAGVLKNLELGGKVLVVEDSENLNLVRSTRNLPKVKTVAGLGINIHDLLSHEHLLISKRAVLALQEVLQR